MGPQVYKLIGDDWALVQCKLYFGRLFVPEQLPLSIYMRSKVFVHGADTTIFYTTLGFLLSRPIWRNLWTWSSSQTVITLKVMLLPNRSFK
jgi:hypothetical protein